MTPLDIEILLHYHCSGDEFPRLYASACRESVDDFLRHGLLRERTEEEHQNRSCPRLYEPTDRAAALVVALCAVPYPEKCWRLPGSDTVLC